MIPFDIISVLFLSDETFRHCIDVEAYPVSTIDPLATTRTDGPLIRLEVKLWGHVELGRNLLMAMVISIIIRSTRWT